MLGYFIYAAAVIAYLDPNWLYLNKDWVNTLVRDAANPSLQDNMFPFSRMMDWYHGHSFAKGLFESADSKDEESSSEDAFFSYAIKMWGQVIGDDSMEARGNLMLAIQARTLINYLLLQSNNVNQPANFIGNKVTGIVCPPPSSSHFLCKLIMRTALYSSSRTKSTTQPISALTPNTSKGTSTPPFFHQPPPSLTTFTVSTCSHSLPPPPLPALHHSSSKNGIPISTPHPRTPSPPSTAAGKGSCMGT